MAIIPQACDQGPKTQDGGKEMSKCGSGKGARASYSSLQELPLHQWEGLGVSCGLLNSLSSKVNSILGLSFLQPPSIENLPGGTGDRQEFS